MQKVEHILVWIMWALVAIVHFGGGDCSSTEFAIMTVAVLMYGRATG